MKTSNSVRLAAWCAVFGIAQACGGDDEAPSGGTSAASVGGGTSTGGTGAVGGTGGTGATGGTVTGGTGGTMVDPPAGGEAGGGGAGGASEGGAAGAPDEVGGAGGEGGAPDSGECDPKDIPVGAVDCCGCLCGDATWSCSDDTCIDADGRAVELAPEAGFFEIAGGPYVSEGADREAPLHRVWYAFRPADEDPESKPLAVFYNGGPGSATTILFSFNTNFYTLDPEVTGGEPFVENPICSTSISRRRAFLTRSIPKVRRRTWNLSARTSITTPAPSFTSWCASSIGIRQSGITPSCWWERATGGRAPPRCSSTS
jgi:hypothetical protein